MTELTEQLARDRVRLVELDVKRVGARLPGLGGWFLIAALSGSVAWGCVVALAVLGLAGRTSLPVALATMAVGHGLGAALYFSLGRRSTLQIRERVAALHESLSPSPGRPAERPR